MKTILKLKWPILIGLIILTAALFLLAPNLTEQAEEAGSFQLSEDASSQQAADILADAGAAAQTISVVIPMESELDDSMRDTLEQMVADIEAMGEPVTSVLNPVESEELEEQLISEDGETILIPITLDGSDEEVNQVADEIRKNVIPSDLTAYITGEAIINNDVNISAQEGLKRTEIITVILIFGLLLAVFRSIVTPFIPLVAVGISYLLSQSIVAFFIDWFGFPVSNYTQIFLVAILFGIGTDYCILLLSRYKEELSSGHGVEDAIVNTYRTAGRTLLISGLAVFIGFSAIGFADFPIFKSAVAVAVGIFVLLLVLFTVVPFFMAVLKEKLFWPSKKSASHSDSKIWIWMSKLSINRPLLSMLVVAIITVPLLFTYDNDLSFNTVDEIGGEYESVKGLRAIEDGFGKGESLPVQVIFKSDDALTNEETIPYFELVSREVEKIDGVDSVRAITRPTGDVIEELYVDEQLGLLADGLTEARDGLGEVQAGLAEIETNLSNIAGQTGGSGGIGEAAAGLGQLNDQLGQVTQGLQQTGNIQQTVGALTQISGGLTEIEQGLQGAAGQTGELGAGLGQLAEGVASANEGLAEIEGGLTEASEMMQSMSDSDSVRATGLFIPEGTLDEEEFEQVFDRYTFADETGVMMEVILAEDPYSPEAIDTVAEIKETVERSTVATPLEDADIAFGGIASINSDLQDISSNDFTNTVAIMLVSLFIVLAVLFRSLIMPLYMIGSLLLTYYTSIAIAELIFVNGLGFDGISWAVPFFGFVMLVALGVDYSIFLLDRFREESFNGISVRKAMYTSMAKMGTVIITAAIILAGTFGAMMPSGVLSLVQIATIVVTGLLLYGLLVLPLLIPAISVSFDRGVWWPFGNRNRENK
ncbi:MMPL family transporter [Planococcus halotolerans]|uniref:MMPL family transporter n=1 Tax=Planococcus halotolerans TaxID=2233542 RepID=A0A365KR87_9BACL|nr:MMPL family transporter [Planococcus halotolerans]QHJ69367.1 MMPL family transporter [Planococcus halotolerans]RAZ75650.1 MMPL family transporter [Planococcus halotolerans]